jgi:MFS family permease
MDAFDFFLLVFVLSDVARQFDTSVKVVSWALTLTLALRVVGALLFGRLADRDPTGRACRQIAWRLWNRPGTAGGRRRPRPRAACGTRAGSQGDSDGGGDSARVDTMVQWPRFSIHG